MLCEACGKRIGRGAKCLILALGRRTRLGVHPVKEEIVCCSRACGARVLTGDVFAGAVANVPEGKLWPEFPKPAR
jgi:hypothetical protein